MMTLCAVGFVLAVAPAAVNPPEWQEAHTTDKVTVWTRDVPDTNIHEAKAEGIITAPIERVWDVITDITHFTEFFPYVVEARVVAHGKGVHYEYVRLDPPLVSKRDYTLKVSSDKNSETGKWVRTWTAANEQGPPPRSDAVRLAVCDGSWTLTRLDEKRTHVSYWVYTDPGGSVPTWIANKANTRSLPDVLAAVQNRSVDPAWTR